MLHIAEGDKSWCSSSAALVPSSCARNPGSVSLQIVRNTEIPLYDYKRRACSREKLLAYSLATRSNDVPFGSMSGAYAATSMPRYVEVIGRTATRSPTRA